MLKTRIIPTLLWKNVGLVKGVGFDSWRGVGTVMPAIKVYNTRDVDELVLLDIVATADNRTPDYAAIEEYAAECFVPLTVGGGITSLEIIRNLLRAGADKITINTAAYENPDLINRAAERFGVQCVVASIDFKKNAEGKYHCMSHSGTHSQKKDPVAWAREMEKRGAGEILLTSVERDGTMEGYDIELIQAVSAAVSIPVIASGGAGSYADLLAAIRDGGATAVAAASIFHFTQQTPAEARAFLDRHDIPVRNSRSVRSQVVSSLSAL